MAPEIPEIPGYVTYANDMFKKASELSEKLGDRFEQTLKETVVEMATKSDLRLVEERIDRERESREEGLKREAEAREKLTAELEKDEEKRNAKMRRLWGTIWGVFGLLAGSVPLWISLLHR